VLQGFSYGMILLFLFLRINSFILRISDIF